MFVSNIISLKWMKLLRLNNSKILFFRHRSKQGFPFPLPEMWLCLYGHKQSGSSPQTPSEAGLHHGCWVWEVHSDAAVQCCRHVHPQQEADSLPLPQLSVRSAGAQSDDCTQVSSPRVTDDRSLSAQLRKQAPDFNCRAVARR